MRVFLHITIAKAIKNDKPNIKAQAQSFKRECSKSEKPQITLTEKESGAKMAHAYVKIFQMFGSKTVFSFIT